MGDLWLRLLLIAALVVVNAILSAGEIALISLSEAQASRLADTGRRGRLLERLHSDPNRFLATVQVGITLAGFLASATAALSLGERLAPSLEVLGAAAEPVAIVVITLALAFVTLVFGELAPKRLGMQRAEAVALTVAPALGALEMVARPLVWLLSGSTDLVVRALGGDPDVLRAEMTEQELRDLLASSESVTPDQARVLADALDVADLSVRNVMVPRTAVVALEAALSSDEALRQLVAARHTRAPVYDGDLDHVIGIAHVLDLAGASGPLLEHVRPMMALPEFVSVLDALRQMQHERLQMAMVIDEHGGVEGMITVEDLVEELVGEIFDEFDRDDAAVIRTPGGSLRVRGDFAIHDLPDVGVELPPGDYTTIGGLVLDQLGRIPEVGERVDLEGWRLTVTRREEQAVTEVRLDPLPAAHLSSA